MTAKSNGIYAADGSEYITLTDGVGNLVSVGTGTGTVTTVSVTTANGVSGSVATATSTPAITLTLGAITPTTVNKVTLTAPASGSTLTIADGKTLTCSNILTFTGTDSSSVAFGAGGTVAYNTLTVDADNRSVSAAESSSTFTNEGATALDVFTLPTAVANLTYTGVVQDADGFKFVANTGDTIRIAGTVSASAGYIQSTTIGSTAKLVAINATEWIAVEVQGSWTVDS